jgi:hypothetical protein
VPLDQHIEGGHGEGQTRRENAPSPDASLFEMADQRQHREHRLHESIDLATRPLTQFEIRGIALGSMEAGITQDNHAAPHTAESAAETFIRDIGRVARHPDRSPHTD